MKKHGLVWLTLLVTLTLGINLAQAGPGTKAAPVKLPAPFDTAPGGNTYTYYANSPAGKWNTAFSNASSNSGKPLRKFVDSLPGLTPAGANNLGAYIPIAAKKPNPVPGDPADYYEIEVTDFNQQMHSDLPGPSNGGGPGTKLRGYRDMSNNLPARYLGPLIIGTTYDPTKPANVNGNGAPVRIKFVNSLGTSNNLNGPGDLFIPVDPTAMGAGVGPDSWTVGAGGVVSPSGITDKYLQNRAELHLHGGVTPWISDGTPHQWITPAVDSATRYPKGVTQTNVPDMTDPGPGAATYYYSNQQSARLMWYHDHAYGLTRLNAYVGEAAGYLLLDQAELDMIAAGTLPDVGTPLIVQDKTFVPQDILVQDAKWTNPKWGTYGDLWFPHVYEPNQNPRSLDGSNPYGRWDYGPWFWPPVALVGPYQNLPSAGSNNEPTLTPEGFMDTALVNGTAYPYMNVEPKAYRFRMLNGANDRPLNFQLYVSDPASPGNVIRVDANGKQWGTEVAMVPAAKWPTCKSNTPATPTQPLQCSCTAAFSPKGCRPATWPSDGRDGGVPDPQFIGPSFIQIGTEGGLLPAPVVIDNQPVSYDYNRRNIVVLDILNKSLLLAPAERADFLIDFTAFAGKTIILYNDAPAPMPAFDSRYDYYTDGLDQTANGGAPATAPGYGPNTRTFMQFRVGTATTGTALHYKDVNNVDTPLAATLDAAVKNAFALTQPAPIVPESAYNATYGTAAADVYSTIFDNSLTFTPLLGGAAKTITFQSKAIQELWDPYGRMNATLGIELPMTNNRNQTTIPYGYVDPPTEFLDDNGAPLLWKITHNGVDTHPVHFHLYNVQVINRVGWDGAIRPPDANELGWKETVRMKPLEDIVVAFQPILPKLPFGLPKSQRLMDPAFPAGAISTVNAAGAFTGEGPGFMNIDPLGRPIVVVNAIQAYDHEYVWHCHILGHEENDFMRPQIVKDTSVLPSAPVLTVTAGGVLTWTDATPAATSLGNPANEIGYRIERAIGTGAFVPNYGKALANTTSFTDVAISANTFSYRVIAYNAAGDSNPSNTATVTVPLNVTISPLPVFTVGTFYNQPLVITASNGAAPFTWSAIVGGTLPPGINFFPAAGRFTGFPTAAGTYNFTLTVADSLGASVSNAFTVIVNPSAASTQPSGVSMTFSVPSPQVVGTTITLTGAGVGGSGTYEYQYYATSNGGGSWTLLKPWSTVNTYAWNTTGLPSGSYTVQVNVRNVGSTLPFGVWTNYNYTLAGGAVAEATGSSMTFSVPSPQVVGTTITLTGAGVGGSGTYEYQYYVSSNGGGSWTLLKPWSTVNTYAWNTTGLPSGTYTVQVNVRNVGSTLPFGVWTNYSYTLLTGGAVAEATGSSMTFSVPSPQVVGTTITLTGAGVGGSGTYEYQYYVTSNGGGSWTLLNPWSTVNTYAWNTTGVPSGTYTVQVNVRNVGSTLPFGVWTNYSYTLI